MTLIAIPTKPPVLKQPSHTQEKQKHKTPKKEKMKGRKSQFLPFHTPSTGLHNSHLHLNQKERARTMEKRVHTERKKQIKE